jgi:hypothetical protein
MQDLSEPAKRMLEALKADETPSKASADRMWAAVAATGAAATVAASLGKGKLLLLGALGITGGVALWVFAGPPALEPTTSGSARSSTDARVAPANVEAQAELPPASVVETPAPALDAPAPAPVTAPEPAPVVPRSLAKKTPVKPSASATQAVDLERELALLSDAKARGCRRRVGRTGSPSPGLPTLELRARARLPAHDGAVRAGQTRRGA